MAASRLLPGFDPLHRQAERLRYLFPSAASVNLADNNFVYGLQPFEQSVLVHVSSLTKPVKGCPLWCAKGQKSAMSWKHLGGFIRAC